MLDTRYSDMRAARVTEICDPDGKVVATEKTKFNILSDQTITVRQRLYVNSPNFGT